MVSAHAPSRRTVRLVGVLFLVVGSFILAATRGWSVGPVLLAAFFVGSAVIILTSGAGRVATSAPAKRASIRQAQSVKPADAAKAPARAGSSVPA